MPPFFPSFCWKIDKWRFKQTELLSMLVPKLNYMILLFNEEYSLFNVLHLLMESVILLQRTLGCIGPIGPNHSCFIIYCSSAGIYRHLQCPCPNYHGSLAWDLLPKARWDWSVPVETFYWLLMPTPVGHQVKRLEYKTWTYAVGLRPRVGFLTTVIVSISFLCISCSRLQ
jgi:hypothetical protein